MKKTCNLIGNTEIFRNFVAKLIVNRKTKATMTEKELQEYLLQCYPKEDARCEWKEFKNLKNFFYGKAADDVVSYVSAISNMNGGHLVIGVEDHTLKIVGTDYSMLSFNGVLATPESATFKLTEHCIYLPSEGLDIEEFVTEDTGKIVWIVTIPKHKPRTPVLVHKKAWQRIKDSLVPLTEERRDAILSEPVAGSDWSGEIMPGATIEDLDPLAIRLARDKYKSLHTDRASEIDKWDDITFLNKAHITKQGKITNAAIILLGREESEHFISPAVCKIRWQLKDGSDENKDFRILSIPMILAVEELCHLVRNTNYTYTISGSMFPDQMQRYDVFTLREPICNCIAHQDYGKKARIEVVEYEDESLMFRNYGQFLPQSVEDVVEHDFPESEYRNPFLVEAMRNIRMVETEGGGIRKLYLQQKKRFFPMPEYDISGGKVICKIQGKVLDENFAKILVNTPELTLPEIILLDRVQKHLPITDDTLNLFRKKGYIEGRKPNVYLSAKIVNQTRLVGLKTSYVKNRSFDDDYFMDMILHYIKKFRNASRRDVEVLIIDKLSDALNEKQKKSKVGNILTKMRKLGKIQIGKSGKWEIV